tara:strand:- start:16 stop:768 length:753 start_codon:yes stop_codon:yes gene_type:complete
MFYAIIEGKLSLISFIAIIFVGILPTLIVEITKGLQVGKSYLSSLTGVIITLVLGYEYLELTLGVLAKYIFTLLTIIQILRFYTLYKSDLLPCRMAPQRLRNFLIENNIKDFYTYKTNYNTQFVGNLLYGYESEFNVKYVKTILDCPKDSIFIVPPTSSKSVSMETQMEAILEGNYRKDPYLNSLLDDRKIANYSIAKFKTLGNSKFYVNESEVTSFRYHILKQVTDHDRFLSYGWVLNLELLKNKQHEL